MPDDTFPAGPPLHAAPAVRRSRRLRILTWHVHGNYLYYLSHVPHDFHLVVRPGHPPGHAGKVGVLPWGANVHEVASDDVASQEFDCVLYQSREHWDHDRLHVLSETQRRLPAIVVQHDPPWASPDGERHWAAGHGVLLVHVTHFNALMWDNAGLAVRVVEHGVVVPPDVRYTGEYPSGIVVVNHLERRGRRLGADLFERFRQLVPLELVGMEAERSGGRGEIPNLDLPSFMSRFRFFFHPVRWTSLGLAVVEAMMIGMPVIGLASTELSAVIDRNVNGYIDTDVDALRVAMTELIADPALAKQWGDRARRTAEERFSIDRFVDDWVDALAAVTA